MGYSGNPTDGSGGDGETELSSVISPAMIAFLAISFYNVLELDVIIFSSFKRRRGLYFWSFLAATNGIAPHSIGFLLKNLMNSHTYILYITLVAVGWVPMVTGQSLVLYSRLHLIVRNPFWLRMVLAMIIFNACVLHIPIIILMYGSNASAVNSWTPVYQIYERVQVTIFCLQERTSISSYFCSPSVVSGALGGINFAPKGLPSFPKQTGNYRLTLYDSHHFGHLHQNLLLLF